MIKQIICIGFAAIVGLAGVVSAGDYSGGGNGSAEQPYRISTAADMNEIGANPEDWGSHFVMVNDINLADYTGTEFNIIGNDVNPFTGVFDGKGHTISNFTYTYTEKGSYIGLFAHINDPNAKVRDLGLVSPHVTAGEKFCWDVGGLVGRLYNGSINNCYVEEGSVTGSWAVGGLVGYEYRGGTISDCWSSCTILPGVGVDDPNSLEYGWVLGLGGLVGLSYGPISDCYSTGSVLCGAMSQHCGGLLGNHHSATLTRCYATGPVVGGQYVGGLVGLNQRGVVKCWSSGSVSGDWRVGGLVGENDGAVIRNCYSLGDVSGTGEVGGFVGMNRDGATVLNCYSVGNVEGTSDVGGLVGYNSEYDGGGTVETCLWDTQRSGRSNMCGHSGGSGCDDGEGKTTAQMQTETTFTDAGWDFVGETINGPNDIWDICEGTNYPRFLWQIPLPGDFFCPDGVNFADYAFLAEHWLEETCASSNDCEGSDLDQSGAVDINDLKIFADNWLEGL